MNNTRTAFDDYNNNKPGDGVINSYLPDEIRGIKKGSSSETTIINNTKSVYCLCATKPEEDKSNDNTEAAIDFGVNMVGFNLFSYDNSLISYLSDEQKFAKYSFYYKPNNLLYIPVMTTPPVQNNTNNGNGVPRV
jgi:hypothetical protein